MIQKIKQIIFAFRYKRAVRRANKRARLFGLKYYVILLNGKLRVVPKRAIRDLIRMHRFRKGVTVADIKRVALHIANPQPKQPCS